MSDAKESPQVAALKSQRADLVASVKHLEGLNDGVDRATTIGEEKAVIETIDRKLAELSAPAESNPS